ncbi:MAG: hypothetical protein ONB17_08560 [candidate division KSB1 bacterium]|nr:hypothetical protein [candidate division KSB1 bacterium]
MEKKQGVEVVGGAGSEAERSEAQDPAGARRGRPRRRGVDERTGAIVELLSGKATVVQMCEAFRVSREVYHRSRGKPLTG